MENTPPTHRSDGQIQNQQEFDLRLARARSAAAINAEVVPLAE